VKSSRCVLEVTRHRRVCRSHRIHNALVASIFTRVGQHATDSLAPVLLVRGSFALGR